MNIFKINTENQAENPVIEKSQVSFTEKLSPEDIEKLKKEREEILSLMETFGAEEYEEDLHKIEQKLRASDPHGFSESPESPGTLSQDELLLLLNNYLRTRRQLKLELSGRMDVRFESVPVRELEYRLDICNEMIGNLEGMLDG